jgi:hypothetical protein
MAGNRDWEGTELCHGTSRSGLPCTNFEIEGLDFCLQHVSDEDLDDAESVTGFRRCRHDYGTPGACHFYAVGGTDPPACKNHGANIGSNMRKGAEIRKIEDAALDRLSEIMTDDAAKASLLDPLAIGNPLEALLALAAEIKALRVLLRGRVMKMDVSDWRYTKTAVGEQVRAELILYERAMDREAHVLVQIAKLRIEEKLAAIEDRQVVTIERALTLALQKTGVPLVAQQEAKLVLLRELKKTA